jgi:hypothetical protein
VGEYRTGDLRDVLGEECCQGRLLFALVACQEKRVQQFVGLCWAYYH